MRRQKQTSFEGEGFEKPKDWFGGHSFKTNAKSKRPLSSKLPIHVVLRTDHKNSMRKPKAFGVVDRILYKTAKKHGVKIYEYANVGNHLHLLLKIPHVRRWAAFIRELTGRISQELQQLKGPQKGAKYWSQRPFTRIVQGWRKAYKTAKEYVVLNRWEAEGRLSRKDFKSLAEMRLIFTFG